MKPKAPKKDTKPPKKDTKPPRAKEGKVNEDWRPKNLYLLRTWINEDGILMEEYLYSKY